MTRAAIPSQQRSSAAPTLTRRLRSQRGFTLIELMVALVVSTLLVGMILAISLRMTLAYRGQQQVSSVQHLLSAARVWIERDAKQAGYGMAQGFAVAMDGGASGGNLMHAPVEITNSATGPDELAFHYADPAFQALVVAPTRTAGNWPAKIIVDDASDFEAGDLVVVSTASVIDSPLNPTIEGKLAIFRACVVRIDGKSGTTLTLSTAAPWGTPTQEHCSLAVPDENVTMIYKFVARAYRIDPARPAEGVLQLSTTGDLDGTGQFADIGFGFTDLQAAGYFFDGDGIDTNDPDTDPARDWQSGSGLAAETDPELRTGAFKPLLQLAVSIVARTSKDSDGIGTAFTPLLTDETNVEHNMLGDRLPEDLATTANPRLQGSRIYRHTTFYVDLRNTGVGR